MTVLDVVKGSTVTLAGVIFGLTTIISCYIIAVALGHVPAWLPMISDCAVDPPESYIFRIGIINTATLLELNCLVYFFYLKTQGLDAGATWDKAGVVLVTLGNFGLSVVGAVNEDEDMSIHGAAAVVFFVCTDIYMVMVTLRLRSASLSNPKWAITPVSIFVKSAICVIATTCLILFAIFSSNWGKWHIQIALCEWIGTFMIIFFNASYVWEYNATNNGVSYTMYLGAMWTQVSSSSSSKQRAVSYSSSSSDDDDTTSDVRQRELVPLTAAVAAPVPQVPMGVPAFYYPNGAMPYMPMAIPMGYAPQPMAAMRPSS